MTENDTSGDKSEDNQNAPDLGKLAEEYMNLWQKQLSTMAADKDVANLMAQSVAMMNTGTAAVANMAQMTGVGSKTENNGSNHEPDKQSDSGTTDGTPSACPSCGFDQHVIDDLREQLKRLEERIHTLES